MKHLRTLALGLSLVMGLLPVAPALATTPVPSVVSLTSSVNPTVSGGATTLTATAQPSLASPPITFRGAVQGAAGDNPTFTQPSGLTAYEVILQLAHSMGSATPPQLDPAWNISNVTVATGTDANGKGYSYGARIADWWEPSSYTTTGNAVAETFFAVSGANRWAPVESVRIGTNASNVSTIPASTPTRNNSWHVIVLADSQASGGTVTPPAGYTLLAGPLTVAGSGTLYSYYKDLGAGSAGVSTGVKTATWSGSSGQGMAMGFIVMPVSAKIKVIQAVLNGGGDSAGTALSTTLNPVANGNTVLLRIAIGDDQPVPTSIDDGQGNQGILTATWRDSWGSETYYDYRWSNVTNGMSVVNVAFAADWVLGADVLEVQGLDPVNPLSTVTTQVGTVTSLTQSMTYTPGGANELAWIRSEGKSNATNSVAISLEGGYSQPQQFGWNYGSSFTDDTGTAGPKTFTFTQSGEDTTDITVVTYKAANVPLTGTVTFNDGSTTLGTSTLSSGSASLAVSSLSVGSHSLTATYSGDTANAASTSAALAQVVNASATPAVTTTTTLTTSQSAITQGEQVSLSVAVSGSSPTGQVNFLDGASNLGSATLVSGTATLPTTALAVGTHTITASYAGDAGNLASTSSGVTVTVSAVGAVGGTGGAMTYQYGYDAMGRLTTSIDPNGQATYIYYDSLGRPIQTQQPPNVGTTAPTVTQFSYNAADSLTRVADPRNLTTNYSPDGLGQVTALSSPDSGNSGYTYDAAGNLLSKTDARGKLTSYSYDALNRLTSISYPTGTATTLEYDGGATPTPAAAGELTKITDESGTLSYAFDSAGRLITKTQVTNGKTFVVRYTWGDTGSAIDKLTSIAYPSGNQVNYAYDSYGGVTAITVSPVNPNGSGVGSAIPFLSTIGYNATGDVSGWSWASGRTQSIGFDAYGMVSGYNLGNPNGTGSAAGVRRTVARDGAGRITGYTHTNNAVTQGNLTQAFGYDNLNRLLSANQGTTSLQYSYDANGNRTAKVVNSTTYTNTVATDSNRLTQVQDVGGTTTIQSDAAGNVTSDGIYSYTYSDRGRLATATTSGGAVNYRYNALEQRVYKSGPTAVVPTGASYYVYDEAGKLLGEYDANGNPLYETIYLAANVNSQTSASLAALPVGVLKQAGSSTNNNLATTPYNVYADQLGAPRMVTRASDEAIAWRWDAAESYGGSAPDQNPSGLGTFTYNQRLPGQTFDSETGLFQNWNREYNPRIGRYIESDPIGLKGGINTYAYANGGPLVVADPMGLLGNGATGAKASPVNKGRGYPAVDYFQIGVTAPVYGVSLAIDRYRNVYFGVQTGSTTPIPSAQACFGKILGTQPVTEQDLKDFLGGAGGQISLGQFIVGGGFAFSGGRTAAQISVGTPQLPGGGAGGYAWQLNGK